MDGRRMKAEELCFIPLPFIPLPVSVRFAFAAVVRAHDWVLSAFIRVHPQLKSLGIRSYFAAFSSAQSQARA